MYATVQGVLLPTLPQYHRIQQYMASLHVTPDFIHMGRSKVRDNNTKIINKSFSQHKTS